MAVFGRDTLITCLQTLIFGPELAQNALTALASSRPPRTIRPWTPSRGRSSTRSGTGKAATTWFPRYYGTADATPLFLVLLSELWRWTDDAAFVRELREPAMRALNWIDEYGDLDGDGFVEYHRRSERGLENQSWKDSHNSQLFHDGHAGDRADRAVRGAGLRLRREGADGRAGARGVARPRARRPAGARGGRAARALRRGVLVRGPRRLLRARPRRREAAGGLAQLQHRPSPVERHRAAAPRGRRGRPADGRRPLVRLGRPHDVRRRTPATARSRTTTGRSGRTTTP